MVLVDAGRGDARVRLSRRVVLINAVALIDRSNLHHLTMRRLGESLGVQGMTLYGYVTSREDLLDGIVDLVVNDLYGDLHLELVAGDWPGYLRDLAYGLRDIARAHPQVFPLIATRTCTAAWVRPPLRSLRWAEGFLDALHRCGFTDPAIVTAYRAFCSFLLGQLLPELAATGVDIAPTPPRPLYDALSDPDPARYPQLSRLRRALSRPPAAADFDESLTAVLRRIQELDHPGLAPAARSGTG